MAGDVGNRVLWRLREGLSIRQYEILEIFKRRTPGFFGEHVVLPPSRAHRHPLPRTKAAEELGIGRTSKYTQTAVNSWKFKRFGGRQIGAVINNAPYIEALEYGWFSKGWRDKSGKRHPPVAVPGHYMARGAVRHGRVRQLYAETAKKALIIGLSETKFRLKKTKMRAARGREILAAAPTKKEGVHMFVRKGRLVIRGNVSGVTRAAYKKITNELFLAVSDMFTG